jgi:hypothetical protein
MVKNLILDIQKLINTNFGDNIVNIKPNPNINLPPSDIQFVSNIMKPINQIPLQNANLQNQKPVQIKSKENFTKPKLINKNEVRYAILTTIIYFIFSQPQIANYIQKYVKKTNIVKPIILSLVFFSFFITSKYLI